MALYYTHPLLYTPPHPFKGISGVGGWGSINSGPINDAAIGIVMARRGYAMKVPYLATLWGTAIQMGGALRYDAVCANTPEFGGGRGTEV